MRGEDYAFAGRVAAAYERVRRWSPNFCIFLWPPIFPGESYLLNEWGWGVQARQTIAWGDALEASGAASIDREAPICVLWETESWRCLLWPNSLRGGVAELEGRPAPLIIELAFEMDKGGFWFDATYETDFGQNIGIMERGVIPDRRTPAYIAKLRDMT